MGLFGNIVFSGSSGRWSKILVHLSFQVRNVHLDRVIRKSQVAPLQMCPSGACIFQEGKGHNYSDVKVHQPQ